jgi:hypothetical protein
VVCLAFCSLRYERINITRSSPKSFPRCHSRFILEWHCLEFSLRTQIGGVRSSIQKCRLTWARGSPVPNEFGIGILSDELVLFMENPERYRSNSLLFVRFLFRISSAPPRSRRRRRNMQYELNGLNNGRVEGGSALVICAFFFFTGSRIQAEHLRHGERKASPCVA